MVKRYLILLFTALLLSACEKDPPHEDEYADVYEEYTYRKIPYSSLLDPQSEYLIVIGDIQNYTRPNPNIENLRLTMDWIWSHIDDGFMIRGVLQTGDITQSNSEQQWRIFDNHMLTLRKTVPVIFCAGNHDYPSVFGLNIRNRQETRFNDFVNYADEAATMLESYEPGWQENALFGIETNSGTLYVLVLEYAPRHEVTEWAKGVIERESDKKILLLTHSYLTASGGLTAAVEENTDEGEGIWEKLVYPYDNVRTVLCGHNGSLSGRRTTPNLEGREVTQIMLNPQLQPGGGDSWIQIWKIGPQPAGEIEVITYNIRKDLVASGDDATFRFHF